MDRYQKSKAPFIPLEPTVNERFMRESNGIKKKGKGLGLAALLKQNDYDPKDANLNFDEKHFN